MYSSGWSSTWTARWFCARVGRDALAAPPTRRARRRARGAGPSAGCRAWCSWITNRRSAAGRAASAPTARASSRSRGGRGTRRAARRRDYRCRTVTAALRTVTAAAGFFAVTTHDTDLPSIAVVSFSFDFFCVFDTLPPIAPRVRVRGCRRGRPLAGGAGERLADAGRCRLIFGFVVETGREAGVAEASPRRRSSCRRCSGRSAARR